MKSVLYVVDALRQDHLSRYGYRRKTSPRIDAFAEDATVFHSAYAQSTWTRASAGSILTGRYPPASGIVRMDDGLPPAITTFPENLPDDVATLCVSSMGNVSSTFGFDRCFDEFVDLYRATDRFDNRELISDGKLFQRAGETATVFNPTSADLNDELLPWLKRHRDQDFFVLVWSIDTHDPYDPLERFRKYSADESGPETATYRDLQSCQSREDARWIVDRYDDLVRQNDHAFGVLIDHLRNLGIYEETNLTFTSDHGEAFGEYGEFGHANRPIEAVARVPLLIKPPGGTANPRDIHAVVQHADLGPTIIDLFEGESLKHTQGQSLAPALLGDELEERSAFSHTNLRRTTPTHTSLRSQEWKYIRSTAPDLTRLLHPETDLSEVKRWLNSRLRLGLSSQAEFLYSVTGQDVDESDSVADKRRQTLDKMRGNVDAILKESISFPDREDKDRRHSEELDGATRDQLEKMGYL